MDSLEPLRAMQIAIDRCLSERMSMSQTKLLFETILLQTCLSRAGNNQNALADLEGVHRNTIARTMKRLGVEPDTEVRKRHRVGRAY